MVVEMALLVLIAVVVFAFVLAPLVRPDRTDSGVETDEQPVQAPEAHRDVIAADNQPVRDTP